MTREELSKFNGQNGQPAYVAIGSIIYDVSDSPLWKEGNHEGVHQAGYDLSIELKTAPHVAAVIERFPSVARLEEQIEKKSSASSKLVIATAVTIALICAWTFLR